MNSESSVTEILRLTSPQARVIAGIFLGVNITLAVVNIGGVRTPLPTLLALALLAASTVLITLPAAEPFPVRRSALILLFVAVSTVLVDTNLPRDFDNGYVAWHFGANTLVLLFLGLRGRSGLAWVGFAIMVASCLEWTMTTGEGNLALLLLLPFQLGTLLVGTLFAITLRRTSRTIAALHAEQAALASSESAARAAAEERARQAASLNALARPALERIARGGPYSDEDRDAWMRLEASVRDRLRAPGLDLEKLAIAANEARQRGVEVTLLDDSSGGLESPADREAVVSAIIGELEIMRTGRLIGRVLPRGRGKLATILVDDGESTHRTDVG